MPGGRAAESNIIQLNQDNILQEQIFWGAAMFDLIPRR